ncbi:MULTISPECIES: hypothetical protein [Methylobacteriaceae]|uniref:hypothetical protein n=1 Tax=Methylobacteriaceae TaxID=119045 RepID=UPI001075ECB6|nr:MULTISPECIES: hypothetical protein [Methylobacteriaceae]TFZ57597.1 hypothetical protein E4V01_14970 [Methylorubrum sp. Q1]
MRRLVIRNVSSVELGLMLEPWTDREDLKPGGEITIEGNFSDDDELILDFCDKNFISIWTPPDSTFSET